MKQVLSKWISAMMVICLLMSCVPSALMEGPESQSVTADADLDLSAQSSLEPIDAVEIEPPVPEEVVMIGDSTVVPEDQYDPADEDIIEDIISETFSDDAEYASAAGTFKLTKNASYSVTVGQTFKLDLKGKKAKSYKSSNTKVATVKKGTVKAKKAGKANITVTLSNGKKLVLKLTVKEQKITGVIIDQGKSLRLWVDDEVQLSARAVSGSTAMDAALNWSSDNKKVATVSNSGLVRAVGIGKANITAKAPNGKKAKIVVKVTKESEADTDGSDKRLYKLSGNADLPKLQQIESEAFAGTAMTTLSLPDSVSYIASDALAHSSINTIYANENSYAWNWAHRHGFRTEDEITKLDNLTVSQPTLSIGTPADLVFTVEYTGNADSLPLYTDAFSMAENSSQSVIANLRDDGIEGDAVAGDNIYSGQVSITPTIAKQIQFYVSIEDLTSNTVLVTIEGQITAESIEANYEIHSLRLAERTFVSNVSTIESCILYVSVLKESDDAELFTLSSEVGENLTGEDIVLALSESDTLPDYFKLSAVLKDAGGNALCQPFVTIDYTKAYADFKSQTRSDFANNIVIDYGEEGFIVFADDTKALDVTPVKTSEKHYVTNTVTEVSAGDIVVVQGDYGEEYPIRVKKSVPNADGSMTIIEDDSATISDLYRSINLSATEDLAESRLLAQADQRFISGELLNFSNSLTLENKTSGGAIEGSLTVSASAKIKVSVDAYYDLVLLGKDKYKLSFQVDTTVSATATCSGKFSTSNLKDAFGRQKHPEIELYKSPVALLGAPVFGWYQLDVTVPIDATLAATGTASIGFTNTSGYVFSDSGNHPISNASKDLGPDASFSISGSFTFTVGPKVKLEVNALGGLFTGGLSGQVGLKIVAESKENIFSTEELRAEKLHACGLCVDIKWSLFCDIRAYIKYKLTPHIKGSLLDIKILPCLEIKLPKLYCSVTNDADSCFKGHMHLGTGDCPNYKYKVTVHTLDKNGSEVTGIPISIVRSDNNKKVTGNSKYTDYFYPAEYSSAAQFDSGLFSEPFTITNSEKDITIREKEAILSGYVTDSYSGLPVPGAKVSVTLSDGRSSSGISNASGGYTLVLPIGTYTVSATADGYDNWSKSGVRANAGANTLNITMPPTAMRGALAGEVKEAEDGSTPISGASIAVYKDGTLYVSTQTDSSGRYRIDNVIATDYEVRITADKHIKFTEHVTVHPDGTTYTETLLMVEGSEEQTGVAEGRITDAIEGTNLSNVSLTIRSGWNNAEDSDVIQSAATDSDGRYSITLPIGNYTVSLSKDGYVPSYFNIVVIPNETRSGQDYAMVTIVSEEQYQFKLTWGEDPEDLDSHMVGNLPDGSSFHVYYIDKSAGLSSDSDYLICQLDVDDTDSYGPEHVNVKPIGDKAYYYYVHHYSGEGTLPTSNAFVELTKGGQSIRNFHVPTDVYAEEEWYWNVCAIIDGRIIIKDTITSSPDLSYAY